MGRRIALSGGRELPILDQPQPERADAARSRRTLLAAAREMMRESGVGALSMDGLAVRAGVGVGTVYRRFGDRAGLAYALLDQEERRFQKAFMFGPPPLGPGAPPRQRIRAFLHEYIDRLAVEADLHALAEARTPTTRYHSGAYQTMRIHLITLLERINTGMDSDYLADTLLALLTGGLFVHQHRERGMSTETIKANLDQLLDRLLPAAETAESTAE